MQKKQALRGLSAACSSLLVLSIFGSQAANNYASDVNNFLGIKTTVVKDEGTSTEDADYYPTGLSTNDINDVETLKELEAAAVDENVAQEEEGAVLLKNDNDALPLAEGSNVTLLGSSTVNVYLGRRSSETNGMGTPVYTAWADEEKYAGYEPSIGYVEAMKSVYNVNQTMIDAYQNSIDTYPGRGAYDDDSGKTVDGNAPAEFYTDDMKSTFATYGDAAVLIFSRYADEDNDFSQSGGVGGISELALQPNEVDLLKMVKEYKDNGTFKKVIVLVNSSNPIELGSMDDYGVDAILWIGFPGSAGMRGVTNILTGKVSPSGKLADTYAVDSTSAPANMNAVDNTGVWENGEDILNYVGYYDNESSYSGKKNYVNYIVEAEGIYVGYKYYETRYEDCILGQGNADGTAGTYASTGAWNYNEEVSYPFGYGLSYTTFDQTLDGVTYNSDTDNYEVKVTVTNNGTVSGKSVVQVYAQTPYGDYEKQNAVEKASVQLAGFAKTGELAPGASETVTVEVQKYFLASYDSKGAKGYILSAGDYYLAVGDDAHDAVNNILAAKGAANMTDVLGNPAAGNASKVYTWNEKQLDTTTYANSRVNADVKVTNQFDDADLNSWLADTVTYLSRSDWEGTYPVNYSEVVLNVTEEMIKKLADFYEKPADSPAVSDFIQGEDSGITFIQMKDVDYDDDEIWDAFLNQFTTDELLSLLNAGTEEIARLGIPAGKQVDDNIEIMSSFVASPDQTGGQYWVCEVVTSSTFNTERFAERGRLIGLEVEFCGYNESWYGGGNLHRIPFGGRNQQYYSEDGVLGYYVGAEEAKAMQDVGVAYSIKHFAGNNQETDRESVSSFFTEQAFREEELRAFEGAFTEGGCLSVMTAFNRLGLTYCGYSSALNQNVLRDEWGFKGHNTTDAIAGSLYKQNWGTSLAAGTDYYCFNAFLPMMGVVDALEGVGTLINNGDGYILQNLRRAVKNTIYTWLHSVSVNGLSSTSVIVTITPWWKPALTGVIAVLGVVSALLVVAYILSSRKKKEAA